MELVHYKQSDHHKMVLTVAKQWTKNEGREFPVDLTSQAASPETVLSAARTVYANRHVMSIQCNVTIDPLGTLSW